MERLVKVWQVGKIPYKQALKLQLYLSSLHRTQPECINDTILLVEHPPVYTTGIRTKQYSKSDEDKLTQLGLINF